MTSSCPSIAATRRTRMFSRALSRGGTGEGKATTSPGKTLLVSSMPLRCSRSRGMKSTRMSKRSTLGWPVAAGALSVGAMAAPVRHTRGCELPHLSTTARATRVSAEPSAPRYLQYNASRLPRSRKVRRALANWQSAPTLGTQQARWRPARGQRLGEVGKSLHTAHLCD